jgi:hypothetical protein
MTKPIGQRAKPGDKLRDVVTSQSWNALLDMRDQFARSQSGANIVAGPVLSRDCLVEVRNDTGADLTRFAVVGLDGVTVEPSENEDEFTERHVLIAEVYNGVDATKFAVIQEDIPDGEIGRAVVCGVTVAQINVGSLLHKFAKPVADDTVMVSGESGHAKILHVEETGDDKLGLIVIGGGLVETTADNGGNSGTSFFGCDFTNCVPDDSAWMIDKTCGGCTRLPYAYELQFPVTGSDNACPLLAKRFYEGFSTIQGFFDWWVLEPVDAEDPENCTYESAEIECTELIEGRCGFANWEWSTGFDEINCSVTWVWAENECTGAHHFHSEFNITSMTWEWVYDFSDCVCTEGDYSSYSFPTPPPTGDEQTATTVCEAMEPYAWQCTNSPTRPPECSDCGSQTGCDEGDLSAAKPVDDGTSPGQEVVKACTIFVENAEATGWSLLAGCACGTSDPPPVDGTTEGEQYQTLCVQEEGYENPARYKWRLVVDGCDSLLTLISISQTGSETVVWSYSPAAPRCWCCNCTNTMFPTTCGPFPRGYYPPGYACLKPAVVDYCPSASFKNGAEVDISVPCDGFTAVWNLSGPIPSGLTPPAGYAYHWPDETVAQGQLWGPGTPNLERSCLDLDNATCEMHSPIVTETVDGDEYWFGISMCMEAVGGEISLRVNLCKRDVTASGGGTPMATYAGTGGLNDDEYTLDGPAGTPPCGSDFTDWPATITVRRL